MSFVIKRDKTKSINEGGRKLKVGAHAYKITDCRAVVDKLDPRGKKQQVLFVLQLLADKTYTCNQYLSVMADNDQQREIAAGTLVAFADAAGIKGDLKPERLKTLIGKIVVVDAKETAGKGANEGKTYVNIKTVEAYVPAGNTDEDDEPEGDDEDLDDEDDADDAEDEGDSEDSDEDDGEDDDGEDGEDDDEDADAEPEPPSTRKPSAAAKFAAEDKAKSAVTGKKYPWGKPKG